MQTQVPARVDDVLRDFRVIDTVHKGNGLEGGGAGARDDSVPADDGGIVIAEVQSLRKLVQELIAHDLGVAGLRAGNSHHVNTITVILKGVARDDGAVGNIAARSLGIDVGLLEVVHRSRGAVEDAVKNGDVIGVSHQMNGS